MTGSDAVSSSNHSLITVQYVRAVAALSVVLFHYRTMFKQFGGSDTVASWVNFGYAGVDVFFVVAGFVMAWTTRFETAPGVFLWRRFCRIYLAYWPIALAFLAFKYQWQTIDHHIPDGLDIVGSFLLIEPQASQLLIYATWSLPFEILFYAMFAFSLAFGRAAFLFGASVVVGAALGVGSSGLLSPTLSWLLTSPLHLEFLLGVVLGHLAIEGAVNKRHAVVAALLGATVLLVASVGPKLAGLERAVFLGFGSFFALYALIWTDLAGRAPKLPALRLLGDASYAIYLLHVPLMYVMRETGFAQGVADRLGVWILTLVFVTALLCLSVAYYLVVERRLIRWSRRWLLATDQRDAANRASP